MLAFSGFSGFPPHNWSPANLISHAKPGVGDWAYQDPPLPKHQPTSATLSHTSLFSSISPRFPLSHSLVLSFMLIHSHLPPSNFSHSPSCSLLYNTLTSFAACFPCGGAHFPRRSRRPLRERTDFSFVPLGQSVLTPSEGYPAP